MLCAALKNAPRRIDLLSSAELSSRLLSTYANPVSGPSRQARAPRPRRERVTNTTSTASTSGPGPEALSSMPRYLRRQMQFTLPQRPAFRGGGSAVSFRGAPSSSNIRRGRDSTRRPNLSEEIGTKRLLEPHVLSARLKTLCGGGKIDQAVSMLKTTPLDAQNTQVWNTLIWECMKAQRFSLAYQLFVDLKRRGFSPTGRTFQTMFQGWSRIEHWPTHTKQLANAHSLYESYRTYIEAVKRHDPDSPELSVTPLVSYIKLLGDAGEYQDMFDVFYAMDKDGPLAPNQFIYAALLQAIADRRVPSSSSASSVQVQNASDTRLIWRYILKASEKPEKSGGFPVDSYILAPAILSLARGRSTDQTFAFQIVREYLGLAKPGDALATCKVPLSVQSLTAALVLCNSSQQYALCIHYFQQVLKRPAKDGGAEIITRTHVEEVLRTYVSLAAQGSVGEAEQALLTLEWMLRQEAIAQNGPKIRPAASTFNLVLMACWRGSDWASATRAFELMTGYSAADFQDGATRHPRAAQRSEGRNLVPGAETMSCMMRAALASGDRAALRQCLRIVDHIGLEQLFAKPSAGETESKRTAKHLVFYQVKLAGAIVEAVTHVSKLRPKITGAAEELERWNTLKTKSKEVVRRLSSTHMATPQYENTPGAPDPMTRPGDFVEYRMATRQRELLRSPKL